jgi:hypothetical protein
MPCMNLTSACDRGGSVALVDEGSVLLGLPGAPGCTTTGSAESAWCARASEQKKPVETLAASSMRHSILRRCRSSRVVSGVGVNPTLRSRVRRRTKPYGVGVSSASAFTPGLRVPVEGDRQQKTTLTITPRSQHRPNVRAIATLGKDGGAVIGNARERHRLAPPIEDKAAGTDFPLCRFISSEANWTTTSGGWVYFSTLRGMIRPEKSPVRLCPSGGPPHGSPLHHRCRGRIPNH